MGACTSSTSVIEISDDPIQALCQSIFTRDFNTCHMVMSSRTDWEELTEDTSRIMGNGNRSAHIMARILSSTEHTHFRQPAGAPCNYPGCLGHRGGNPSSKNICLMADLPLHVMLTVSHNGKYDKKFLKILKYLLDHGFNPNLQDFRGTSALHAALSRAVVYTFGVYGGLQKHKNYTTKFIIALCESGANVNLVDTINHHSPLHKAAEYNVWWCVPILLVHGALIDMEDSRGRTALMMACEGAHVEAFGCLLGFNADVHLKNSREQTALHVASELVVIEPIAASFMIHKLLERGADPNVQDLNGDTPLHIVARRCTPREVIVRLLRYGADPSIFNNRRVTPFFEHLNQSNGYSKVYVLSAIESFLECLPKRNQRVVRDLNNQLPNMIKNGPCKYLLDYFGGEKSTMYNPETLQDSCVAKIRSTIGIRKLVDSSITIWKLRVPHLMQDLICGKEFRRALTIYPSCRPDPTL